MAFFEELKRRNVYRVAVLYVVVSWLLLQVTDVVSSVLALPVWAGQLIFLLLSLGLPVALVLAWAFELTPEGLRRDDGDAIASVPADGGQRKAMDVAIIAVLAVALGWFAWHHDWRGERGERERTAGDIRALAVLPLENLMNDPGQAYFVAGMHEALITELSRIQELHVISRTSTMAFEDSGLSMPEIARQLGVDAVVEGSVLKAGDTVRVTVQLIEAETDRHLWADNFDRPLQDILGLYGDVAREIAREVRVSLSADEVARMSEASTVDPDVYERYLQGRFLCDQWTPESMRRGTQQLETALQREPDNAEVLAHLALCIQYRSFFGYLRPLDVIDRVREMAERAVALAPELAAAWVALAAEQYYLGFEVDNAVASLERALALEPNNVRALMHASWLHGESGDPAQALAYNRRALELDPLSTIVVNAMGQIHYLQRDFQAALVEYRRALSLDPGDPSLHYYVARTLEQQGAFDDAIDQHRQAVSLSGQQALYQAALAYSLGVAGLDNEAEQAFAQLQSDPNASPYDVAIAYLGLGRLDLALDWLERAFEARDSHMLYINRDARFDPLRSDPRFQRLMDEMNFLVPSGLRPGSGPERLTE